MTFTNRYRQCAGDVLQYSVSFAYNYLSLFYNDIDFTSDRDKELGRCFFLLLYRVGS